jgi:hypothetical protein
MVSLLPFGDAMPAALVDMRMAFFAIRGPVSVLLDFKSLIAGWFEVPL